MAKRKGSKWGVRIKIICAECNGTFSCRTYIAKIRKYCSRECVVNSQRGTDFRKCLFCKDKYYASPSDIKIGKGKFCSLKCARFFMRGKPTWNKDKHNIYSDATRLKMGLKKRGCKLSLETRRKMSESRKGNKSNLWRGGVTSINKQIRSSFEYKLWRTAVFERDKYTCVWCGNKESGYLNADHIKQFAYYPELRFDINNGRTLCIDCHRQTETYSRRLYV